MKPERTKRSPRDDTARAAADRQAREIERLQRENGRLREQLDEQAKRIADLERQLALRQQNSTTTSKPPSSDGLAGRQRLRGRRVKSRRKAGGQPGHPGHHRELVPLERVDAVVDLVPETCRRCAHTPPRAGRRGRPAPASSHRGPPDRRAYYRVSLSSAALSGLRDTHGGGRARRVRRAVRPAARRADCVSDGRLPLAAPGRATVARRRPCRFRSALGSPQHAWEEARAAVAAPYKELRQALANQPVLNADETGHRRTGRNAGSGHSSPQPLCSIPSPPRVEPTSCGTCSARPLPASWAATDCRRT